MNRPDVREWWIREWTDSQPDGFLSGNVKHTIEYDVFHFPQADCIHVIRKADYDALLAKAEKLAEALARIKDDPEDPYTGAGCDQREVIKQALEEWEGK